jgi:uncharacterized coiled-coil protein SlyX
MGQTERVEPPARQPDTAKSPMRQAQMADEGDGDMGMLLGFVGVVALVGIGAFAFLKLRRRGAAVAESDEEEDDGDANPFSAMTGGEGAAAEEEPASSSGGPQLTLDSLVDDIPATAAGADAADQDAAGADLGETTISASDLEGEQEPFALGQEEDGPAAGAAASAPSAEGPMFAPDEDEDIGEEEMAKLIQQFEQRIAALESRLDEQAEARERLERQVAAQTEELRVQRAAIARTQRAVRNLTRGEEDGPTEPALRDPNG